MGAACNWCVAARLKRTVFVACFEITINASVSDQRAMQLAAHAAIQLDASGVKDTLEI